MNNETSVTSSDGDRFLSFSLGAEEYAMALLSVKEVIALPELTPVPFTPSHFLGIMNLRGQVISVLDLRKKLGITPSKGGEEAVVICDFGTLCLGVVVDSVNSVVSPAAEDISERPQMEGARTDYISGIYRRNKRMILLIDIALLLDAKDLKALENRAA